MGDIWPLVNGLVGAIIGAAGVSLQSYFRKKGENLATKEDIGVITREIEQVRLQFSMNLENMTQRNRLQLAAIDKRLETHQQAYALWRKFQPAANDKQKLHCLRAEFEEWWSKHCLYLSVKARQALSVAYEATCSHQEFRDRKVDQALLQKNWEKIGDAVEAILEAVALPSLGDKESGTREQDDGPHEG